MAGIAGLRRLFLEPRFRRQRFDDPSRSPTQFVVAGNQAGSVFSCHRSVDRVRTSEATLGTHCGGQKRQRAVQNVEGRPRHVGQLRSETGRGIGIPKTPTDGHSRFDYSQPGEVQTQALLDSNGYYTLRSLVIWFAPDLCGHKDIGIKGQQRRSRSRFISSTMEPPAGSAALSSSDNRSHFASHARATLRRAD